MRRRPIPTLSAAAPRFVHVHSTPGVSTAWRGASSMCANPIEALYQPTRRSMVVTALNPIARRRYGVFSVRTATYPSRS